jgi:ParB family chromosome partitioning protein
MAKKRPKVNLAQAVQPRSGDLEKLFATEGDIEQASGLQLLAIRLDVIEPDPEQPRRTFPDDSLQELGESIKQDGVIQPIEVTEVAADRYRIVHGERRWRAALLAGLETMPAVVRRRDYDTITRFVRQLVENIQREDLNDVDRAAGLLHLRDLLQEELDAKTAEGTQEIDPSPWAKTITWAKVGKRLGYSRQRIHQLIRLLDLPDEIKEDVRAGKLSERDTRIYQGLQSRQQRDLHRLRYKENLTPTELRLISRLLKKEPVKSVSQAINELRRSSPGSESEASFNSSFNRRDTTEASLEVQDASLRPLRTQPWTEESVLPARQTRPTNIDRLDWVRGHLARVQRYGVSPAERREILRLLNLIKQDVSSLIEVLQADSSVQE